MEVTDGNIRTSSVDANEIDYFDKWETIWWNSQLPLHKLNEVRVPLIKNGLSKSSNDVSESFGQKLILEVGCGGGILSEELAKLGGILHSIDPCSEAIAIAKQHALLNPELTNLSYFISTIEQHALHNYEQYDVVVASEVIEHVTDKDMFLESCIKCLKPGGTIFITTFNKTWSSWLISVIIVQEILNIIPRGTHAWNKFISPEDLSKMLEKLNCSTIEISGINLNFMTLNWNRTTSLSTSYFLQAVKQK